MAMWLFLVQMGVDARGWLSRPLISGGFWINQLIGAYINHLNFWLLFTNDFNSR